MRGFFITNDSCKKFYMFIPPITLPKTPYEDPLMAPREDDPEEVAEKPQEQPMGKMKNARRPMKPPRMRMRPVKKI